MTKIYQVINYQYQTIPDGYFGTLDAAKNKVWELQKIYKEGFYVIQLDVAHVAPSPS